MCEPGYAEVLRCTESAPVRCVFINLAAWGCSQRTPVECVCMPACLYVGDCVISYMCVNLAL